MYIYNIWFTLYIQNTYIIPMMSAAWGYQLVGNYLGWGRRGGKLRNTYKPMKTLKNEKNINYIRTHIFLKKT